MLLNASYILALLISTACAAPFVADADVHARTTPVFKVQFTKPPYELTPALVPGSPDGVTNREAQQMIAGYFAQVSPAILHDIRTKLGLKDNARAEPMAYPFEALPSNKEVWFEVPGTKYTGSVFKTKKGVLIGEI